MKIIALFFVIFPFFSHAQVMENFSDRELHYNPSWFGQLNCFEVVNPAYSGDGSLNSSAGNDSCVLRSSINTSDVYLLTPCQQIFGEWRFSIADGYNWSVSAYNDYSIILFSDDSSRIKLLNGSLDFNGYFLRFDGSKNDVFCLYKQTGTVSELLINSNYPASTDGNIPLGRTIKITHDAHGLWSVYIDDGFNTNPSTLRGECIVDTSHTNAQWFGIVTNIANPSASRVLYFDQLYIGDILIDTLPPYVNHISWIDASSMEIRFNESIHPATAANPQHFCINNGALYPDSIVSDASIIKLFFDQPFIPNTYYTISVRNIADLNQNILSEQSFSVIKTEPLPDDIIITEIMADPLPSAGLPEHEYIEIVNRRGFEINLCDWTISIGNNSPKKFKERKLAPDSFLIITTNTGCLELSVFGATENILGTDVLLNAGTRITISDNAGKLIHELEYNNTWYRDTEKMNGGYSLEIINPAELCLGENNWRASENEAGGTPGHINSVNAPTRDLSAPEISNIKALTNDTLLLFFSEKLNPSLPLNPMDISINSHHLVKDIIMPDVHQEYAKIALLQPLEEEKKYLFSITKLSDPCENVSSDASYSFLFYTPKVFDILINEIMADPEPAVDLPEHEYVEIRNTKPYRINLSDWVLEFPEDKTKYRFPDCDIDSLGYLLLCHQDAVENLKQYGQTLPLFSSRSILTNAGKLLTLRNNKGNMIHLAEYSESWYPPSKIDGGWSLELIDPDNPCGMESNWTASKNHSGGTPGQDNSTNSPNADEDSPRAIHAIPLGDTSVKVFFNEIIDSASIHQLQAYTLTGSDIRATSVDMNDPYYRSLTLRLSKPLESNMLYTLELSNVITDCSGNELDVPTQLSLGLPVNADSLDVIINEILFNPVNNGVDYVELFNRSDKIINLHELYLSDRDQKTFETGTLNNISPEGFLMLPGNYALLTINPEIVMAQYYTPSPDQFIRMKTMPTYSNDNGRVVLVKKNMQIIDELEYSEDMHLKNLDIKEGVSLERIHFNRPTNDPGNWHSAAQTVGFGTPAYKNSQFCETPITEEELFQLEPQLFSPDNDGYNDILQISYNMDKPGYFISMSIFDAAGRLQKNLLANEQIASEGVIVWDGTSDSGKVVTVGIYIIFIQLYHPDGETRQFKKTCVVAKKGH